MTSSSNTNQYHTLHVGNLQPTVTEQDLYQIFSQINPNVHVVIKWDSVTNNASLCHGCVHYTKKEDAARALVSLNRTRLAGKPMIISWYNSDPYHRVYGEGNIFVSNLAYSVEEEKLEAVFRSYGPIESVRIVKNDNGKSEGYGYVQFQSKKSASDALQLHGHVLDGLPMHVALYRKKSERGATSSNDTRFAPPSSSSSSSHQNTFKPQSTNPQLEGIPNQYLQRYHVMVSNLPGCVSSSGELFDMFGTLNKEISSASVLYPGYGHVYFNTLEAADRTVRYFNGIEYKGATIHVRLCTTSAGTLCDIQHG